MQAAAMRFLQTGASCWLGNSAASTVFDADELAGRPRLFESRKVRTSQSRVIANSNPRRLAGKCHRKQTATLAVVRVKRCGKSAPAFRVTGVARQTPPEARSRRPHHGAVAQVPEGCSPEPAGRPLEAPGNGVPRWMVAAALPGNAEQNPAYRPTRPALASRQFADRRSRFLPGSCSAMTELSPVVRAQSFLALLFADDRGRASA